MLRRAMAALLVLCGALGGALALPVFAADKVDPAAEQKAFQAYFHAQFPNVPQDDFVNGPYSMDKGMRKQWEEIMQFPPYDFALDEGKKLFETPFKNGKSYADCFPNKGIGVRQDYPYFDTKAGEVVTLSMAVNRCREANGEQPLNWETGPLASIIAYMSETSRGKRFDIKIPDDPRALAAYEDGEQDLLFPQGPAQFLLCELSRAICRKTPAGRRAGAGGGHPGGLSDLPFRLGQHGNDRAAVHQLRCANPRRAVEAGRQDVPEPGVFPQLHE